eukprot:6656097-Pyramimonas_sp.AAC.1
MVASFPERLPSPIDLGKAFVAVPPVGDIVAILGMVGPFPAAPAGLQRPSGRNERGRFAFRAL